MAYSFNGTSDYTHIPTSINGVTAVNVPLTFSVWFKTPTQTRATARVLLEIGDLANACCGASNGAFRLVIPANVSFIRANAFVGTTAYTADTAAGSLVANTWMHAAAVFASNSSRTIYLSNATPVTNTQALNVPHGYYLSVASSWASATPVANFFSGDIAEVGVWKAALTAAEINSLSKGVSCRKIRPDSIFCYFPLVRALQGEFARLQPGDYDPYYSTLVLAGNPAPSPHPRVYL
jgi:hypothetical protein